jgi:trehalose/maltose hydrolase-like predicted phosphorylase
LIGNGYLSHAKGVRSDTMFLSGVYNGETTSPSHRARIPATLAVTVDNSVTTGVLLDIQNGVYHRRGNISNSAAWYELRWVLGFFCISVLFFSDFFSSIICRWFAHRTLSSIYAMELEVHLMDGTPVTLSLSNNAGSDSTDIQFATPVPSKDGQSYSQCGSTLIPEVPDSHWTTTQVCLVADKIPSSLSFTKAECGKVFTFVTSYATSLEINEENKEVLKIAQSGYEVAHSYALAGSLLTTHSAGWEKLWKSGIEIKGRPDVAKAVNASMFYILSSVREEWAYGLAPGGLTNYYNGHSFWDTETWMYPPLLFLHPEISQELLLYRFNRLEGAKMKAASYSPPWSG